MDLHSFSIASMSVSVVPWLDVEEDGGLGDHLGLLGLLLVVGLQPLFGDPLLLLVVLFIIRPEEIHIIIIILCRSGSGLGSRGFSFTTVKLVNTSLQGEDEGLEVVSHLLEFLVLDLQSTELLHECHLVSSRES